MGLLDRLRGELIDIIEWLDDGHRTLVWRFPRWQNEIKSGAQLIVRPGQQAIFVDRGQIADVFAPGTHTLAAPNLPILSTLQGWKYGFESPFKAEVYFVSTTQVTDLKWGTQNPVMLRDADFGPLRLRAFGTYALRAADARALLQGLVGTDQRFEADEVGELLRSLVNAEFAQTVGESKLAALDLAANLATLSDALRARVQARIDDEYGLELTQLVIASVSLPPEVEKAMDTRTSMGVIGDMQRFQQYQLGNAVLATAQNPAGGLGVVGAGLGLGLGMAAQVGQMMPQQAMVPPPPPPPPTAGGAAWHLAQAGRTVGPFDLAALASAAARSELTGATMVWTPGMSGWVAAGTVPALAHLFPPPPPPPTAT